MHIKLPNLHQNICYLDLIGMLTNPLGTLLGPTGLGIGGGGSAVPPPGSEIGTIASAKMAQDSSRELNEFNAREAEKGRTYNTAEAEKSRLFNAAESAAGRGQMEKQFNSAQAFNKAEAETNRKFQASQVKAAQDYNTSMSNSAYQRSMADMKKAGLNPMLAFMNGGASSPQSATASGSQASSASGGTSTASSSPAHGTGASGVRSDIAELVSRGLHQSITSAMDQKRLKMDWKETDSRVNLNKQYQDVQEAMAAKIRKETGLVRTEQQLKEKELNTGTFGKFLPKPAVDWFSKFLNYNSAKTFGGTMFKPEIY